MAFNFNRSYEVSDDGVAIENGVHIQSGSGVPVHAVTNASVYFRTNGEIYTNDLSGWVLFAGSGGVSNIDGGLAASVYLSTQSVDGGNA